MGKQCSPTSVLTSLTPGSERQRAQPHYQEAVGKESSLRWVVTALLEIVKKGKPIAATNKKNNAFLNNFLKVHRVTRYPMTYD